MANAMLLHIIVTVQSLAVLVIDDIDCLFFLPNSGHMCSKSKTDERDKCLIPSELFTTIATVLAPFSWLTVPSPCAWLGTLQSHLRESAVKCADVSVCVCACF